MDGDKYRWLPHKVHLPDLSRPALIWAVDRGGEFAYAFPDGDYQTVSFAFASKDDAALFRLLFG